MNTSRRVDEICQSFLPGRICFEVAETSELREALIRKFNENLKLMSWVAWNISRAFRQFYKFGE